MSAPLRIFFTTDLHGSEKCFKKFVNAGPFYKANVLIMGGDMTGKAIVPLVRQPNGSYTCQFFDRVYELHTELEAEELEKLIRVNGFYPFRTDPEEYELLARDERARDAKFLQLMRETVQRWVSIAEDRLRGKAISAYMTPGNDDHLEIDDALEGSDIVTNPEGKVVELPNGLEMISCGWSGPTPFETPRECSEEELGKRLEVMASNVRDVGGSIFNLHDPPYDSRLDLAPALDENLRVQTDSGHVRMVPVGSSSVRALIERHQPLVSLHGHIHESRAQARIGKTICVNPGSEYSEGVLHGALVDLNGRKVKNVQLVMG